MSAEGGADDAEDGWGDGDSDWGLGDGEEQSRDSLTLVEGVMPEEGAVAPTAGEEEVAAAAAAEDQIDGAVGSPEGGTADGDAQQTEGRAPQPGLIGRQGLTTIS